MTDIVKADTVKAEEIRKLETAEQQIKSLLSTTETNWKTVAKIAIAVREKKLFKEAGVKSFTAWVNALAIKCDRQPSLIWRYIKAAKYYLHTVGSNDVEQIDNAIRATRSVSKFREGREERTRTSI